MGDIAASAVDVLRKERREGLRRFMGQSLSRKHWPVTAALSRDGDRWLIGKGLLLDGKTMCFLPNTADRIVALSADHMSEHNAQHPGAVRVHPASEVPTPITELANALCTVRVGLAPCSALLVGRNEWAGTANRDTSEFSVVGRSRRGNSTWSIIPRPGWPE